MSKKQPGNVKKSRERGKEASPGKTSEAAVYFLGPVGTFSHWVAREMFSGAVLYRECSTLEGVVESLVSDPSSRAVLPVENSSGGTVYDSIDVLIHHAGRVGVLEEVALDIRIALLAKDRSPVTAIYSHFTQIKHHAAWVGKHFPGVPCHGVESTARAAELAASRTGAAALGSPGLAGIYGLLVVAQPPAPRGGNVTHFFMLQNGTPQALEGNQPSKTALVVTLPNVCGSLHTFLGPFAKCGVSLSRIVSRPVRGKPQTYIFYVEIEGDARQPPVAKALARAQKLAECMLSLGSFTCGKRLKS